MYASSTYRIIQTATFALLLVSCRDLYQPDIKSAVTSYLVVEGVLNVNGPTTIRVSRSTQLDTLQLRPETGAQLTVEGKDNSTQNLINAGGGSYRSSNLNLTAGQEYRLRIYAGGEQYVSEYVKAVLTPAIDSVNWELDEQGLNIMVNTHDPAGATRYYRWEYEETWEVNSYYMSRFLYLGDGNIRERVSPAEDVYRGWKYNNFTRILAATSAKLDADIISRASLIRIPYLDERPAVRYSVLVRQYALDQAGYEFYQLMKRNTESLGTIFDAQPTDIRGNITCVSNPALPVIGYVYASTIVEQRKFIAQDEIRSWRYPQSCPARLIPNHPDSLRLAFEARVEEPFEAKYSETDPDLIIGYHAAAGRCVDVTKRNASLTRPLYW